MSNRRVESLTYQLETDDTVSFDADPVEHETDAFSLRLEEDELTVDLHEHFSSVDEARERVDPFLEAWEIRYGIQFRRREISFSYKDAEVIRENTEDDEGTVQVELTVGIKASPNVRSVNAVRGYYPDPPDKFRLSPDARTLWNRYESYEEGREPLFSMGYACYNFLVWVMADGKKEVRERYNISGNLLDELRILTSTRGSPEVARKPSESERKATPEEREWRKATSEERKWIEEAIGKIVLQVGISDAGHNPEMLTKGDLPPLP